MEPCPPDGLEHIPITMDRDIEDAGFGRRPAKERAINMYRSRVAQKVATRRPLTGGGGWKVTTAAFVAG